jgi:four helix bundle protein
MRTFERLQVWELARNLAAQVYKNFGGCRDFGFRDQICRSAMSISSNVAEGVERNSPAEFRNFLGVAKGSAGELRSQLILANDLGYIPYDNFQSLLDQSVRVSQMLGGLIRSIQNGRTYRLDDRIK